MQWKVSEVICFGGSHVVGLVNGRMRIGLEMDEKTVTDPSAEIELTPESYLRFRRALGKLLWMAQVRHGRY